MRDSSDSVIEKMSSEEAKGLMTGGLLGEVYASYKFSKKDLEGLREGGRITHIKEAVSKNLLIDGLREEDYQLMITQIFGEGYPLGAFPADVALYVVVTVPKFPKKSIADNPELEIADEADSR